MSVPALYIAAPDAIPHPCTVRTYDIFEDIGTLPGTQGAAQVRSNVPRIKFLVDDAPAFIRRLAIVSVEAGEAYRIENTHPAHDITILADVTKLTPAEAAGLPIPEAA